jgi:two-component system chemotaxis response regulator CheB
VIKLLIVDDSPLMRRLLGGVFKAAGDFEVALARNGLEALELVRDFQPHVVTLDVHMPEMDGLTCLNRIMLERPCPVVMVSSLTADGADATLEALRLGAVDFVAKPAGAMSLTIDEFGPALLEKIRAASAARVPAAARLAERVKLKLRAHTDIQASRPAAAGARPPSDLVVLVGCSTGGPPALDALLSPLPHDFPWPIIVAQHMPGTFTGPLSRRLDRLCALDVVEVTQPMPIDSGKVYVGKGDADVIVTTRRGIKVVTAAPSSADYRWHPSVDRLVLTAMRELGAERLIGVLMTGMGNDGAQTMARLTQEGGRTIAEAEETAVVWGMPGELVKLGGAEVVAPVQDIAHCLIDWAK